MGNSRLDYDGPESDDKRTRFLHRVVDYSYTHLHSVCIVRQEEN